MNQREKHINWRLRCGLVLCAIIGFAWGFLLTALLTRLNSYQSPWLILGAALPLAFFGSMIVGMAFNRMLLSWLKVVRVLVAMPIFATGVPVGLIWGMVEQQRNLLQLVNATGRPVWELELLFATTGVLAGIWPRWTIPFLRPVGRIVLRILDKPIALFQWIGRLPIRFVSWLADGFATMGRTIAELPVGFVRSLQFRFRDTERAWERWRRRQPTVRPRRRRRNTQTASELLRRIRKLSSRPAEFLARRGGNHDDGLRVTGIVEDRCPYCFDVVKRNDPRGVRVCHVCGAPHHADCWAITGRCQMPHMNT